MDKKVAKSCPTRVWIWLFLRPPIKSWKSSFSTIWHVLDIAERNDIFYLKYFRMLWGKNIFIVSGKVIEKKLQVGIFRFTSLNSREKFSK